MILTGSGEDFKEQESSTEQEGELELAHPLNTDWAPE